MVDNDYTEDLGNLDGEYQSADESGGFGDVPDGDYLVKVERAVVKKSKAGNLMLAWLLVILGPAHVGRKMFRNSMMNNEIGLGILKHDLKVCGVEIDSLTELPGRLIDLIDLEIEVSQKTKKDFANIYFKQLCENSDAWTSEVVDNTAPAGAEPPF